MDVVYHTELMLRYILFHHQTTTLRHSTLAPMQLRYILFHHQTTTVSLQVLHQSLLRYILFHHQTTTMDVVYHTELMLRYILFHHQTTTDRLELYKKYCCVISSFITKPQLGLSYASSRTVALYPLSSPNHNVPKRMPIGVRVALYPLSSPNHNLYFLCIVI